MVVEKASWNALEKMEGGNDIREETQAPARTHRLTPYESWA